MVAEAGDMTRDNSLVIVSKEWDHNGTMRVVVREVGHGNDGEGDCDKMREKARRLARRALPMPHLTRGARCVLTGEFRGRRTWTFAVTRNGR